MGSLDGCSLAFRRNAFGSRPSTATLPRSRSELYRRENRTVHCQQKTVSETIGLARADRRIAATVEQWDSDPWLLNTPSGVFDLRSGKQRLHEAIDYLTKITAIAPDLSCSIALCSFLDRVCKGDTEFISFLRRVVGYSLTGLTTDMHCSFAMAPARTESLRSLMRSRDVSVTIIVLRQSRHLPLLIMIGILPNLPAYEAHVW